MHLEVSFRNLRPRDEIKARAQALYDKMEKFLDPAAEAQLVVTVEHGNAILELVVRTNGEVHTVTEEDGELRPCLDRVFHTMEVRLRRSKERRLEHRRSVPPGEDGLRGAGRGQRGLTAARRPAVGYSDRPCGAHGRSTRRGRHGAEELPVHLRVRHRGSPGQAV
ncbi:MAG: HPF/RaiA family ribosome-associated protein [Myxococcota bacterium]